MDYGLITIAQLNKKRLFICWPLSPEILVCHPQEQKFSIGPHAPGFTGTMIILQGKIRMLVARGRGAVRIRMAKHSTQAEKLLLVCLFCPSSRYVSEAPPHFT
jgi:hypothetical protein